MGGGKLLRLWRGRPLLAWALDTAWAAPVSGVTLVIGADGQAVSQLAKDVAAGRPLDVVTAPEWSCGLSRSLAAGIGGVPADAPGVFVFLGDMPRVPPIAMSLSRALSDIDAAAAAPVCRGRRGHPALLTRGLFPELLAVRGDRAAGPVLDLLGPRLALVETQDDGVLYDVDTPDLLEA